MTSYAERFEALGLRASVRIYFSDKMLSEYDEVKKGCTTMWCELKLSTPEMEEDGLLYELFADLDKSTTQIKDGEPTNESEIEKALDELYEALRNDEDPISKFAEEYERVNREFDEKMSEFEKKMRRLKIISYIAMGVVVFSLILASVLSYI